MNETIGMVLIIVGLAFDFFGCLGLIRFPDVYTRLQASAKCITLGTCGILFGLFLIKGFSPTGIKAFLCILFIVLTAPVSAHALARGAYLSGVKPWEGSVIDAYGEDKVKGG
jgi:multicomponent Na+:H+ antiporter subunit G